MGIVPRLRRRRPRDPEARMTILEHLAELRYRLVWIICSVGVASVAGWVLYDRVLSVLLLPACPYLTQTNCRLVFTGPLEVFLLRVRVAMHVGLAIAFPLVLFHVWRFVAPGLRPREKRYVVPFVVLGTLLFGFGVWFAFLTLPQALAFLIGPAISGPYVTPLLSGRQYVDFMLFYLLAFGLAFEFPLVLMFLSLARVISSRQMARYRRHALVGIALVVAVGTPSVDWYTMTVLTAVMYVLYEACIWISRALRR